LLISYFGAVLVQFVSSLKHQLIHKLGGFLLLARDEMTVYIKGDARLGMSEPFGDYQNWNSMVQHQGGCCMPQIMKTDFG
jgi:hypothetical protein